MYTNKMLRIKYTVLILFTRARDKSEKGRSALQQAVLGIQTKEGTLNRDGNWDKIDTRAGLAYLARCIDYLRSKILTAMFDDFGEVILNGGIIAIDEVSLDELHRERGFA